MLKSLRSMIIITAVLMPLFGNHTIPALSQERQGCFMMDSSGELVDLGNLCPSARPFGDTQELGTGDIQVTLRWATADDLDLAVTDPRGETVFFANAQLPSGGQLDLDSNAGCEGTTQAPIENIFWPPSQASQGNYNIEVTLFSRCTSGAAPIPFEIRLLVQGNVQTLTGSLSEQNPIATFPFSLGL
jgi:hypothetical protein